MRQEISKEVWNHNYRAPKEKSLKDTWERQARAAASVEKPEIREQVYQDFLWLLTNFKGIAGGRITANLGVEGREGTTLMNCFTHNPRDIDYKDPDSIEGIYDMLKAQALTLKSEGGYGMNFSWIRPAGMYIRGIASRTPGVIQMMSLWNQSSVVITMGSDKIIGDIRPEEKKKIRKGAQMGILEIWHPEIEEFIDAKLVEGRLDKFNISIGITEGFMEAVTKNKKWILKFPDTEAPEYKTEWGGSISDWEAKGLPVIVVRKVNARDLWDKIMKATYTRNDPGVLFLDIANKLNPLSYGEDIATTNPCVTGDTVVAVADGNGDKTIKELADNGKDVPVYCEDDKGNVTIRTMRNPRITGTKPVFEVTLENGHTVRATANHKFKTTLGEYKRVDDLNVGDGLMMMGIIDASIKDVFPKSNSNSQVYKWIQYRTKQLNPEHRLIFKYENNADIPAGHVIHHKDFNARNNHISNLQLMTKEEHDRYHGDMMKGDNNPMVRWYPNATLEEKQRYHDNMSKATTGEANGRFSGVSNDELYEHALTLTRKLNRLFTHSDWMNYAKLNKLPQHFSKWRVSHFNGITGIAKRAAYELNLMPEVTGSPKVMKVYYDALDQGYDAEIIDNVVYVNKVCEKCDTPFKTQYQRREYGMCSGECGFNSYVSKKHDDIKTQQIEIYNSLKFKFDRDPMKKEWVSSCKENDVSPEISRTSSPFRTYKDLKTAAGNFNHRIISIKSGGDEVVYNGTVDEFHNFFVGGFKEVSDMNTSKSLYINNLQCGEIAMSTGVCNLMSINLVQHIKKNAEGKFEFNYESFTKAVTLAVRFSDNINDISRAPLEEYKDSMTSKRRIGIGVLALGSLHYILGVRFGSDKSLKLIEDIFRCKSESEILASAELGKEKGSFTKFNKKDYFNTFWWKTLPVSDEFKKKIEKINAMRNSHRSANAPTGNMSLYAGVTSGGIEPVFMREYTRWSIVPEKDRTKLKSKGLKFPEATQGEWFETDVFKEAKRGSDTILRGSFNEVDYEIDKNRGLVKASQVVDYGWEFVKANCTDDEIKAMDDDGVFATTLDLTVDAHIKTLEIIAKYTDMNSSKTINLPNDYPYESFKDVYMNAWKAGIKGITTYRDGTMMAVLEKKQETHEHQEELENIFVDAKDDVILDSVTLPDEYYSKGIVIRDHNRKKWYVNIAFADAALTRPFALFVNTNCKETSEVTEDTIHSMMKLAKTVGIKKSFIDDQLEKYYGQSNVTKIARSIGFLLRHNVPIINIVDVLDDGNYPLSSFTFHIKRLLKQYITDGTEVSGKNSTCPKCGGDMIFQEGCILCKDCGWSRCG